MCQKFQLLAPLSKRAPQTSTLKMEPAVSKGHASTSERLERHVFWDDMTRRPENLTPSCRVVYTYWAEFLPSSEAFTSGWEESIPEDVTSGTSNPKLTSYLSLSVLLGFLFRTITKLIYIFSSPLKGKQSWVIILCNYAVYSGLFLLYEMPYILRPPSR